MLASTPSNNSSAGGGCSGEQCSDSSTWEATSTTQRLVIGRGTAADSVRTDSDTQVTSGTSHLTTRVCVKVDWNEKCGQTSSSLVSVNGPAITRTKGRRRDSSLAGGPVIAIQQCRRGTEGDCRPLINNPVIAITSAGAGDKSTHESLSAHGVAPATTIRVDDSHSSKANYNRPSGEQPAKSEEASLQSTFGAGHNAPMADVKANFIKLIRHNKFQYFYSGALIFSVMNICFIIHSSVRNHNHQSNSTSEHNSGRDSSSVAGSHEDESMAQFRGPDFLFTPLESQFGWPLALAFLLPMTILLALIATITTLEFGHQHQQLQTPPASYNNIGPRLADSPKLDKQKAHKNKCWSRLCNLALHLNLLQLTGLLLTLALLHSPLVLPALLTYAQNKPEATSAVGQYLFTNDSTSGSQQASAAGFLQQPRVWHNKEAISSNRRKSSSTGGVESGTNFDEAANTPASYRRRRSPHHNSLSLGKGKFKRIYSDKQPSWWSSRKREAQNLAPNKRLPLAGSKQKPSQLSSAITQVRGPPVAASERKLPSAFHRLPTISALVGLGSILALLYLEPILLDGSPLNTKLICASTFAFGFIIFNNLLTAATTAKSEVAPNKQLQQSATKGQQPISHLYAVYVFLALVGLFAGHLRRRQFVQTVTKLAFSGADQLIEAKVSLEHQRQQQETLLLSVLPAYVAEQVKRNMVKKINSTSSSSVAGAASATTNAFTTAAAANHQHSDGVFANNGANININQQQSMTVALQQRQHQSSGSSSRLRATTMPSSASGADSQQRKHGEISPQPSNRLRAIVSENQESGSIARLSSGMVTMDETSGATGSVRIQQRSISATARGPNLNQPQSNVASPGTPAQSSASQFNLPASVPHPQSCIPSSSSSAARRGFNELYIRTYNNVSLLYGDIVGFTRLCTKLSSSQLVRLLNDLFSHFDYLAERHKIMRIKILGDCYYGVSGIPEFAVMGAKSRASRNDNHAINCVNMGLDMIQYIKCLNVERATRTTTLDSTTATATTLLDRQPISHSFSTNTAIREESTRASDGDGSAACGRGGGPAGGGMMRKSFSDCATGASMPQFELNMRIGIHSGHIHSGVIGLKKWQFDVWSNDVSIAMHCESSGVAGRVQVTGATIQQLNGAFSYEIVSTCGAACDSFLSSRDIKTYLIRDRVRTATGSNPSLIINQPSFNCTSPKLSPLAAVDDPPSRQPQQQQQQSGRDSNNDKRKLDNEQRIRTTTIETIRETLLAGEACNSSALNSYGLALDHPDINPLTLTYHDAILNKLYNTRPVGGCLEDTLTLLLIFAIVLPMIDYVFASIDSTARLLPLIAFASCILFLTIIGSLDCTVMKDVKSPRSSLIDYGHRNQLADDLLPPTIIQPTEELIDQTSACSTAIHPSNQQQRLTARLRNFLDRRASEFGVAFRARVRPIVRLFEIEIQRTRLRSLAALVSITTVILFQTYLITELGCPKAASDISDNHGSQSYNIEEQQMIARELYYLTVIMLLVSIDLCNHTLSFITKSTLLVMIMLLHFICLLTTNPFEPIMVACRYICQTRVRSQDQLSADYIQEMGQVDPSSRQQHGFVTNKDVIDWFNGTLIIVIALWSLTYSRQLEYTNRTNFLWRNRLNVDHEELEYISGINKVLLENILPSHVVQHYLTRPCDQPTTSRAPYFPRMSFSNMRSLSDELYHEQHDSVAVMFASIPHFYEFYDESDISKQGLGCIALLNEIICDFDKLLLKNKFSRIEKIKTIGSSYMAAAGLRPSHLGGGARSSTVSQGSQVCGPRSHHFNNSSLASPTVIGGVPISDGSSEHADDLRSNQQKLNLVCMIQFATSLMTALNGINKQSFQVFKLRVGVNTGPVIAGIIGAQRPFYDIWGDCVNIASRMESLGQVGRIQVEEKTAKLLMENLCNDTYSIERRGPIDVKGKGGMITYFVDKRQ